MSTSELIDDVNLSPTAPLGIGSLRDPASPYAEAARASLRAVRAARQAAEERARRTLRRTRIGAFVLGTGLAVGGWAMFRSKAQPAAVAAPASAPAVEVHLAAPPVVVPAAPTATAPTAAGLDSPAAEMAAPAVAAPRPEDLRACTEAFDNRHWHVAAQSCAAAFEGQPRDADLAMKVAHAQHARGRLGDARVWAKRALALDASRAEAFVLVARADRDAGDSAAAAEAYRQYLALAPRGWHAAEARRAIRADDVR